MSNIHKEWFEKPFGIVILNVVGGLMTAILIGHFIGVI